MVSAAKLRRAQENVVAARPYADKLREVLDVQAACLGEDAHPLMEHRQAKGLLLIVITADRGLCGAFNSNLCKAGERFLQENGDDYERIHVLTVGRKGYEYFKNRSKIYKNYADIISSPTYARVAFLAQEVIRGFQVGTYDRVELLYNSFRSVMTQDITFQQLLPVTPESACDPDDSCTEYIYEPSQKELLAEILPKNIEVQLFRSVLESVAGEHGARMTAMDSATKNATEMIGKLTLQYNRARQAAITTELMEIISGSESIKG
jgi:F-type H+-transporting ATPase subunit gamma